jgi:hypothetical protein
MIDPIAERTLNDGSQTQIRLYIVNADAAVVEAVNEKGTTSVLVDAADAFRAWMHPFSRPEWLDYPGTDEAREKRALAALTEAEYKALEAVTDES